MGELSLVVQPAVLDPSVADSSSFDNWIDFPIAFDTIVLFNQDPSIASS